MGAKVTIGQVREFAAERGRNPTCAEIQRKFKLGFVEASDFAGQLAAAAEKIRIIETVEPFPHQFSNEELLALGKRLAALQSELRQVEDDFKGVRDSWKARISAVEADIMLKSGCIGRGYEIRSTKCIVKMDTPEIGMKSCFTVDSAELVWVHEMSNEDKQLLLDLAEAEETAEAEADPNERAGAAMAESEEE
jgi:hypothetical protein